MSCKDARVTTPAPSIDRREMSAVRTRPSHTFDSSLVAGLLIAVGAAVAGIAVSGTGLQYFIQPTAMAIVLGGTFGIVFVTTPRHAVLNSLRRVRDLFMTPAVDRRALIDEISRLARVRLLRGMLALEPLTDNMSQPFLRDGILMALDVKTSQDLRSALETELRLRERQAETDAKTFEVAGGFAPTIGIIGTVIGLMEVLRRFTDVSSVPAGIGTAFVSTIYGLGLANLLLLPLAHRIRARAAEMFEIQELIMEGVLLIADDVHPSMISIRLAPFLRPEAQPLTQVVMATQE